MNGLLERFCRYVRIDTQADERSGTYPSSPGQLQLGRMLLEELQALGLRDADLGYVVEPKLVSIDVRDPEIRKRDGLVWFRGVLRNPTAHITQLADLRVTKTAPLTIVAGSQISYTLTLTSHDDNYSRDPTYTLYDDVTLDVGATNDFSLGASMNLADMAHYPVAPYAEIKRWHATLAALPAWRTTQEQSSLRAN